MLESEVVSCIAVHSMSSQPSLQWLCNFFISSRPISSLRRSGWECAGELFSFPSKAILLRPRLSIRDLAFNMLFVFKNFSKHARSLPLAVMRASRGVEAAEEVIQTSIDNRIRNSVGQKHWTLSLQFIMNLKSWQLPFTPASRYLFYKDISKP
jgi:hypothetical protein